VNRKQLVALWIGVLAFVLAALYPPWVYPALDSNLGNWWHWLWGFGMMGEHVNLAILGIEWAVIVAVIAAALFSLRTKDKSN